MRKDAKSQGQINENYGNIVVGPILFHGNDNMCFEPKRTLSCQILCGMLRNKYMHGTGTCMHDSGTNHAHSETKKQIEKILAPKAKVVLYNKTIQKLFYIKM